MSDEDDAKAVAELEASDPPMEEGEPVSTFPMRYKWRSDVWRRLFDMQRRLLNQDIQRARIEDRFVVYLSCPISSRGGGFFRTNVEIANYTVLRLTQEWGQRFWILNPAQYQMESKEGTGLLAQHAATLGFGASVVKALETLGEKEKPTGGDYMRVWTQVLVEDSTDSLGGYFDAFYFLGPRDVQRFFTDGGERDLSAAVEEYFARKFATDPIFRARYDTDRTQANWEEKWEEERKRFFRFYTLRASAAYSLGSHDEWNIWCELNRLRRESKARGTYEQIAGYFDGMQISPGAAEMKISKGYALAT